jgi:hypothetical protein
MLNNVNSDLTRREVLGGGLLFGAALLLTGCQTSKPSTAGLPGPTWPRTPAPRPVGPALASQTDLSLPSGVIPRSEWTRQGPDMGNINPMNGIHRITIHHDGMPPTTLAARWQVAARLNQVRRGHNDRGWADIGYHFIIDPQGNVWEGRSTRFQGAHVRDQNEHNLGIMVLGNFDEQQPTPQACGALDAFVATQMRRYRISLSDVRTHQERASTACPGRNLQRYMMETRSRNGRMAMA